MKRLLTILTICICLSANSQDKVYATFLSAEQIRVISANPSTGASPGSFSNVKNIIGSAALGMTTDGYLVYLQYGDGANGSGNGRIDIWVTKSDGTGSPVKVINNFDVNNGSNDDLGFVRLGVDRNNTAWIISKELSGNDIYLTKFTVNGTSSVSPIRCGTIQTSDNNNSVFENGDLAFDGNGTLFALANVSSSSTKMYVIGATDLAAASSSSSTIATKKWDVKDVDGNNFSGRVNGAAFSSTGSMFISTDNGLYFIDQFSTNFNGIGTVKCTKVKDQSGMSDLATAFWPEKTKLPIKFHSFDVKVLGNDQYQVTFDAAEAEDVNSFEVQVSPDGKKWKTITVILPDNIQPSRVYSIKVTSK